MIDLTRSGYGGGRAEWALGGKAVFYYSSRDGMKSHASWGFQTDVYALFLTKAAYDEYRRNKEEAALAKEAEEKKQEGEDGKKDEKEKEEREQKEKDKKEKDKDKDKKKETEASLKTTPKSVLKTGSSVLLPYCEMRYLPTTCPERSQR